MPLHPLGSQPLKKLQLIALQSFYISGNYSDDALPSVFCRKIFLPVPWWLTTISPGNFAR